MASRRLYELARQLEVPSAVLLSAASELGMDDLVAVSGLDEVTMRALIEHWARSLGSEELARISEIEVVQSLAVRFDDHLATDAEGASAAGLMQQGPGDNVVTGVLPAATPGEPAPRPGPRPNQVVKPETEIVGRSGIGVNGLSAPTVVIARSAGPFSDVGREVSTGRVPMFLILLWAVLLPFQFTLGSARRPLQIAPSDFALALAILVLAPQLRFRPRVWTVWHFAFPAVFAISILAGGAMSRYSLANKLFGMLVLLATYGLITTFITSWSDVRLIMRAFVASVVVVNTVTSISKVVGVTLPYTKCHSPDCIRLTGYFPDANLYGSLLVVAIAMMLGTMGTDARLFTSLRTTIFAFVSLGSGLFLTLSRSSWIGMALVLMALVVLRPGQGTRIVLFGGAVVSALLTFVLAERSDLLLHTAGRTFTIDSRLEIYDNAVKAFQENPFFGIGLGNFAERYNVIVHNTVLWLAAEMGVVGLVILGGLMIYVIKQLWFLYMHTSGAQRAIVTALALAHLAMLGFSIGVEALYQRHWWLTLGLISVLFAMVHERPGHDGISGRSREGGLSASVVVDRLSS